MALRVGEKGRVRGTTLNLFDPPERLSEPRITVLRGRPVEYLLKRSARRRRIVFTVDENGLVVHVPLRTAERSVAEAVGQAEPWILRKLAEWENKKPRARAWVAGELLDFLGRSLEAEVSSPKLLPELSPRAAHLG